MYNRNVISDLYKFMIDLDNLTDKAADAVDGVADKATDMTEERIDAIADEAEFGGEAVDNIANKAKDVAGDGIDSVADTTSDILDGMGEEK